MKHNITVPPVNTKQIKAFDENNIELETYRSHLHPHCIQNIAYHVKKKNRSKHLMLIYELLYRTTETTNFIQVRQERKQLAFFL